ncbi:MAG: hypothetical protein NZL96_01115 [Patescibacteria group bacterium]|nr:hypothetical protein [Patescibacteria group bacterium]
MFSLIYVYFQSRINFVFDNILPFIKNNQEVNISSTKNQQVNPSSTKDTKSQEAMKVYKPKNISYEDKVGSKESRKESNSFETKNSFLYLERERLRLASSNCDGFGVCSFVEITKKDYPKLFDNLPNNFIRILPFIYDNNQVFFLIENLVFETGALSLNFAVIVNPESGRVVFSTQSFRDSFNFREIEIMPNGDIKYSGLGYFFDDCRQCGYRLFDFFSFDIKTDKYLLVNTKYQDEFRKILAEIERYNSCAAENGLELNFEEIKDRFGENFACRSSQNTTSQFRGITPKDYFSLKKALEGIIYSNQERQLISF